MLKIPYLGSERSQFMCFLGGGKVQYFGNAGVKELTISCPASGKASVDQLLKSEFHHILPGWSDITRTSPPVGLWLSETIFALSVRSESD